jgi:hypothetical protein
MGVPLYQLAVDMTVAAALLFAAIYTPLLVGRRLPRWLEYGMGGLAVVLICGVVFALISGHWPFRG